LASERQRYAHRAGKSASSRSGDLKVAGQSGIGFQPMFCVNHWLEANATMLSEVNRAFSASHETLFAPRAMP
jgi:hypothetical protein